MPKLQLSFACGLYDRMQPLYTGEVTPDGIDLNFIAIDQPRPIFDRMSGGQEFDVAEYSLSEFTQRFTRNECPFVAIPVFPSIAFRMGYIAINKKSGIKTPKDLEGKRIGVPLYTMTAAIFINGMLHHEFGVDLTKVHWVQSAMNAEGAHGSPTVLPLLKNISIENNKTNKTLGQLLADGEIDATLGTSLPEEIRTNPDIVRLFPNFVDVDKDLYKRKGIYPIMHTVAIKKSIYERYPFVATSLYDAFVKSKKIALGKSVQPARRALHDAVPDARDRRHLGGVQRRSMALRRRAQPAHNRSAHHLSADARPDRKGREGRRSVRSHLRLITFHIQEDPAMSQLDDLLRDLVVANRILSNEDVVDAYGHISVRHPDNPKRFFMSRSRAPELVELHDLIEFDQMGEPVSDKRQPYLERFIHAAIFEAAARSDGGGPCPCRRHAAVRPYLEAARAGDPFRQLHRRQGAGVGHPQEIRRYRSPRAQHGAGPRPRQNHGQGQRRTDARPRFCLGGALDHRGGAAFGLSAAQCARADECDAHGR